MKIKYNGTYPQVKWKGKRYDRGVWVEAENITKKDVPFDFEVSDGSKQKEDKKTNDFDSLKSISGIGKKTIDDLEEIYEGNFEELKKDAKNNKVPCRDDVSEKLHKHFHKEVL